MDKKNKEKHKNLEFDGDYARLLYPYVQGFSSPKNIAQFKLSRRKCSDSEYDKKKYKIIIKLEDDKDKKNNNKIKNAIKAFHLEELYNLHQLELSELVKGCREYSKAKRHSIVEMIVKAISKNGSEKYLENLYEKRIKNILFGIPRNTTRTYLLKQLKEDLVKQFDSIDYETNKL